ncbi:hypothetical protein FRC08_016042, partial [Ceratobasidium sp. 394]
MASSLKVFADLSSVVGLVPASRVIEGIAASRKMMVVCGGGVSVHCGIPDFHSAGGLLSHPIVPARSGRPGAKWASIFAKHVTLDSFEVQHLNRLMAEFRVSAQTAALSPFHIFLQRAMTEDRIAKCLSRNFDGLETRDKPEFAEKVVMLHGDNRNLACRNLRCEYITGEEAMSFNSDFLLGKTVPCPSCIKERTALKEAGKRTKPSEPYPLRPAVLLNGQIDPSLEVGYLHDQLMKDADGSDTLLIMGTTLKGEAYEVIRDIANVVHESEGVVIYVDLSSIKSERHRRAIDYHLCMDVQEVSTAIMTAMDKKLPESASEIWTELSEIMLLPEITPPIAELGGNVCCQCAVSVPDIITPCVSCGSYFCFESLDTPSGLMCVNLNYFSEDDSRRNVKEDIKSFRCPECHDPSNGMYPHLIRDVPFMHVAPAVQPRLVVLVYYLSEFWPMAKNIIDSINNTWRTTGWACYTIPVRLQSLDTTNQLSIDFSWEPDTYNVMVIYVTHGTSEKKRYQLNDNLALGPAQ